MRRELIKYIRFGFVPTWKHSEVMGGPADCGSSCKGYHMLAPFLGIEIKEFLIIEKLLKT